MKFYHRIKKGIALTAAVTLTAGSMAGLTGCGTEEKTGTEAGMNKEKNTQKEGEAEEKAMGRYLEEDLKLPEDCASLESIQMLKNGSLRICYRNQDYNMCYADSGDRGQNWGETTVVEELLGMEGAETSLGYPAIGEDGSMFFMRTILTEDGSDIESKEYYYVSPDGNGSLLDSEIIGNEFGYKAAFTEKGTLLLSRLGNGILEIDPKDSSKIHEYEKGTSVSYFYATGTQLTVISSDTVHYYDLESGKPLEEQEALTKQITSNQRNMEVYSLQSSNIVATKGEEENSLLYVDSTGAYRYGFGGSVVEQIIDGNLNSIGSPDVAPIGMTTDEEGNIYLAAQYEDGNRIFKYTYSKDTPAVPDTELTVYSLMENKLIRQTAALFQKKYPDIYINLETGMTGEDAITSTDALKTLNTEIMAGKGPDVLLLDGVSQDTYIEKGILEDLSKVLEKLGDSGEILENIKEAYTEEDGKIYCLPLRFGIPMVESKNEYLSQITDLETLADEVETHKDEYNGRKLPMYSAITPKLLLRTLADVSSSAWMKEDGTLDEEAVSQFLTQVNRIYQAGKPVLEEMQEMVEAYEQEAQTYNRTDYSIGMGALSILSNTELFSIGGLYNPSDLSQLYSVEKKDDSFGHKLFSGQGEPVFIPTSVVGISAKAQEKEAAESFVEFLFSEEGQSTSNYNTGGFPVNKAAYESEELWMGGKKENDVLATTSSTTVNEDGTMTEVALEILQPSLDAVQEIQEFGKTLTVPARTDEIILSAVTEAGVRYLKGELELEEAAREAIQKVNLYLSE